MCQSPPPRGTHFYDWFVVFKRISYIVSIPSTSGNSFLRYVSLFAFLSFLCQSPQPRGTHFYILEYSPWRKEYMCQSPPPRGTHFYMATWMRMHLSKIVSIPSTSGNSFLQKNIPSLNEALIGCQFPPPRGTHFYFSHLSWSEGSVKMCQFPPPRGTHFYGVERYYIHWKVHVSIPSTSGNSFLHRYTTPFMTLTFCVNSLHLGELISTMYR